MLLRKEIISYVAVKVTILKVATTALFRILTSLRLKIQIYVMMIQLIPV